MVKPVAYIPSICDLVNQGTGVTGSAQTSPRLLRPEALEAIGNTLRSVTCIANLLMNKSLHSLTLPHLLQRALQPIAHYRVRLLTCHTLNASHC
jgi:hypothetical protein